MKLLRQLDSVKKRCVESQGSLGVGQSCVKVLCIAMFLALWNSADVSVVIAIESESHVYRAKSENKKAAK